MKAQPLTVRRLLPSVLACCLLAVLTPAAWAAPLDIVPGFRITPPPGWTEGDRTRNSFDLVKLSPQGDVLALTQVTTEDRQGHEEALERLADIVAEVREPAKLLVIRGWPVIDRRSTATLSGGDQSQLPDDLSFPPDQTVVVRTVAMAAGPTVVRFETTLASGADERLLDEMRDSIEQMDVAASGDPVRAQAELQQVARGVEVRRQEQQQPPPSSPALPAAEPPAPGSATQKAAQPAAAVELTYGELQIEATPDGRNVVVVANQGYAYSTDSGRTFTAHAGIPSPFRSSGDPSLGLGKSGSFYFGYVGRPSDACATSLLKSTDNGKTFSFLGNAVLCPVKGGCSVDQPQIAVDRLNQANGKDQIYAVWRNKTAMSPETPCASITGVEAPRIVCSSNGGTSFTTPVSVGTGQRPRVVVGGDGFVYVTYMTASSILLNKYSSCASGLQQQRGFPVTVSSYNPVSCPVTGLDRCSNGLSSPMAAVDDAVPSHVFLTWATSTQTGNENIKVADSLDGGKTFPRKMTVSDPVARRRFMPWICATRSVAYLGWYDRFYANTANNDFTRYFGASVASDGANLVANTVFDYSGVDDAQCRLWPCAPDQMSNAKTCSVQPQLAGFCSAPAGTRCDYRNPSLYCAAGATCQTARGCPKYGDYNGIACAAGNVYRAWAAAAPPPGVTAPGTSVKLYARTSKPRVVNFIARHSNKCLDVKDNSRADGAPLIQFSCGSGLNQQFELIRTGSYYQIVARSSGKCVEVRAASNADRAVIQQLACNGGANQRFQLVDAGGGFNKIVIRSSNKCVDVDGASTADPAQILQFTCNGQTNQQFRLQDVTP
jgi:hypothetical protein